MARILLSCVPPSLSPEHQYRVWSVAVELQNHDTLLEKETAVLAQPSGCS